MLCGERPGIDVEVIYRLREVLTRAVLDQIDEGAVHELRIGAGPEPVHRLVPEQQGCG